MMKLGLAGLALLQSEAQKELKATSHGSQVGLCLFQCTVLCFKDVPEDTHLKKREGNNLAVNK